MTKLSDPSI